MKLPMVIYHVGNQSDYVNVAIESAIVRIGCEVVMLTDSPHWTKTTNVRVKIPGKGREWIFKPDRRINPSMAFNQSTSMERWFSIRDWLVDNGHSECLYSDSDVLWFDDPMKFPVINQSDMNACICEMTGCRQVSFGHLRLDTLNNFCNWLSEYITLAKEPTWFTENDMSAWTYYIGMHPEIIVGNTNTIIGGVTFDHHLAVTTNWIPNNTEQLKQIIFKEGHPYGTRITGEEVRFVVLHFWNGLKSLMREYWQKAS